MTQDVTRKEKSPSKSTQEQQQYVTLAVPSSTGGDPQYVQLPADPRVLSGQCSYAVIPQSDGSSQIVLVENNQLDGLASTETQEVVKFECPAPSVMSNEIESRDWTVDITLMYADAPLPFTSDRTQQETREKTPEKSLKELLQDVDKGMLEYLRQSYSVSCINWAFNNYCLMY